jgi:cytochrome P450
MPPLPPGPSTSRLAQTIALARDPLGALRALRERFGPVFTVRTTNGPIVVMGAPEELDRVLQLDPDSARAGEARRRVLPQASPRSLFGGDGAAYRAAGARLHESLEPEAIGRLEPQMAALAEGHAAAWPSLRPFKLRVRLRDLADEIWVRLILQPRRVEPMIRAARHLLRTPGNPPLPPPGEGKGLAGALTTRLLEARLDPFARLVREEIAERRARATQGNGGLLDRFAATELTPQDVVAELAVVTAAATEATASGLTSVLERLAHEHDLAARFADNGATDARLFEHVVSESLRLRPVAMGAMRRLTVPITLASHELPAGAVLMAPSLLLQRDPASFAEPDRFIPERFREALGGPFFPFGGGRRECIGRHLANAEIRSVVPAVLRSRRLRPLAREPEPAVERATIIAPKHGATVLASARGLRSYG